MKTINIPQDLINPSPSPAAVKSEALKDFETETKLYTPHELLELKNDIPDEVFKLSKSMCEIKHITVKEIDEYLVKIDALNYNLVIVKEMLSILNCPIYLDMYTKSATEGVRVTLNKVMNRNKAKSKAAVHEYAKKLRDERQNKCSILDNRLRTYNENGKVELELLKI